MFVGASIFLLMEQVLRFEKEIILLFSKSIKVDSLSNFLFFRFCLLSL